MSEMVIYRCTECGKLSVSLGWLHAHIEKHRRWGPFNLLPAIPGRGDKLMKMTEEIQITEYESTVNPQNPAMPQG